MHVIDISNPESVIRALEYMKDILAMHDSRGVLSIRVGIDPLDSGLKFSVDYGTWSPPVKGMITS